MLRVRSMDTFCRTYYNLAHEFSGTVRSPSLGLLIPKQLLTYLLTPWSRALLEKLTGLQLVKKFPVFYGT